MNRDEVLERLKKVKYPGLDTDIVTLKVVKTVSLIDGKIEITISPRTKDNQKIEQIKEEISKLFKDYKVKIELEKESAMEPKFKFGPQKSKPKTVKNIIAVASGKGGVGKSTVAVNLAYSLRHLNKEVGILDLDFYGPNVPRIMGVDDRPAATDDEKIVPVMKDGIEVLSIGFLLKEEEPLIWRGPLINKAIEQFVFDTLWGNLDFLILDLPPGTGDIQLTMAQKIVIAGAVIVTTPQDVALIDVQKAINMFKQVEVPIIGVVENMAYFKCPHCGEVTHIFKRGGGEKLKTKFDLELLAQLPLDPDITEMSDAGKPLILSEGNEIRNVFINLAEKVKKLFE